MAAQPSSVPPGSQPQPSTSSSGGVEHTTTTASFVIGQRISHHHHRGTVRFVGQLEISSEGKPSASDGKQKAASGEWLGIEWDNPHKGKHWGTYKGRQVFQCLLHSRDSASVITNGEAHAGPASFLRPQATGLRTGVDLLTALKAKYTLSSNEPSAQQPLQQQQEQYSRKNLAEIEIEVPNLEKVRRRVARLDRLRHVGVQGWLEPFTSAGGEKSADREAVLDDTPEDEDAERLLVSSIVLRGMAGHLKSTFSGITNLDLSNNLLWNLSPTLTSLAEEVPNLTSLNLSGNHFSHDTVTELSKVTVFPKLEELYLDRTFLRWSHMVHLLSARIAPSLRELSFAGNALGRLLADDAAVSNGEKSSAGESGCQVVQLNLSSNRMSDWPEVASALSHPHFAQLKRVNLSKNAFQGIEHHKHQFNDTATKTNDAAQLSCTHINISDNPGLTSWSDLEALDSWIQGGIESLVIDLQLTARPAGCPPKGTAQPNDGGKGKEKEKEEQKAEEKDFIQAINWRQMNPADARIVLVARLPNLALLNSTPISNHERREAEIWYLSQFADAQHQSPALRQGSLEERLGALNNLFPRFEELTKKFADSVPSAAVLLGIADKQAVEAFEKASAPQTLRSKLLELKVICTTNAGAKVDQSAGAPWYIFLPTHGNPEERETPVSVDEQENAVLHCGTVKLLPSMVARMARTKILRSVTNALKNSKFAHLEKDVNPKDVALWALLADENDPSEDPSQGIRQKIVVPIDDDIKPLEHFGISSSDDCILVQLL